MSGALPHHPVVYLYCIAVSALLLYVPGFVVAAYGRWQIGYDLREPRTMIDRVPPYARRATWAHENSFEAFALFAPAALMAYVTGLDGPAATSAAVLHPIARLLFQVFYIADRPGLRGPMYLTGLLCSVTLRRRAARPRRAGAVGSHCAPPPRKETPLMKATHDTPRGIHGERTLLFLVTLIFVMAAGGLAEAQTATKKPNILVIWGDDIGYWNISAYNQGMMGYRTPNIDRIAKEGALFTDWYGQQSCTAGRSSFITGQVGFRTGMLKVGLPGAKEGLQARDVTIAELLKAQGYKAGQFGKNHLGDRDEHLPTAHGFDEFFGSLYHLNAEDEPEHPDYFKDPEMRKRYATRGVIRSRANPDGPQKIELTGPLTKKRMETVDEEFTREAIRFMEESKKEDKPFFLWWNSTRMHIWTRLKAASQGKTGLGIYPDGMVEHDAMVGQLLDKLEELGLEDNTIVMYSTDNGAEKFTWPDGGQSPFRGEKNTNWEGGYRVPCAIRWPGVIKPGTVLNDIFAHEDMLPTLLAAAGDPGVKEKLLKGVKAGARTFKVHLDGYDVTDALAAKAPSPRHEFFYFNDDGSLVGLRYDQWKIVFAEQRAHGFDVWQEPFVSLRVPKLFNLRSDPFETADHEGMDYERWRVEHLFVLVPAQQYVGQFLGTFKEYPPSQKPGSFGIDQALESLQRGAQAGGG